MKDNVVEFPFLIAEYQQRTKELTDELVIWKAYSRQLEKKLENIQNGSVNENDSKVSAATDDKASNYKSIKANDVDK